MVQVTTVGQAEEAANRGADLIIAQGGEAGGYGGRIGSLVLIPQIVDAVSPVPVVAAGGIFDGRGLAAALMLGAVGVNLGTRFLATQEAPIDDGWQQGILSARSEDVIKAEALNAINPAPGTIGYGTTLNALRSDFLDRWNADLEGASVAADQLRAEIRESTARGARNQTIAGSGQGAGAIRDVLSVAEVIRSMVAEAEGLLKRGPVAIA